MYLMDIHRCTVCGQTCGHPVRVEAGELLQAKLPILRLIENSSTDSSPWLPVQHPEVKKSFQQCFETGYGTVRIQVRVKIYLEEKNKRKGGINCSSVSVPLELIKIGHRTPQICLASTNASGYWVITWRQGRHIPPCVRGWEGAPGTELLPDGRVGTSLHVYEGE